MEKIEKFEKCHSYIKNLAPEIARISHPKTPNNTRRQPKTLENKNRWRKTENIGTRRRAEMHKSIEKHRCGDKWGMSMEKRGKLGEKSRKNGRKQVPGRLRRMSMEKRAN